MAINLNRLVDISISHITSSSTYERDTALLVLFNQTETSVKTVEKLSEIANPASDEYKFAFNFFNNGGIKLAIAKTTQTYTDDPIDPETGVTTKSKEEKFKEILKSLEYSYIVVMSNITGADIVAFANKYNNESEDVTQLYKKYFLTSDKNAATLTSDDYFVAVKYGEVGCEASIAAYLTKIDLDESNSVNDYMFTEEVIKDLEYTVNNETVVIKYSNYIVDDDNLLDDLLDKKYNVDVDLRDSTRVMGGNTLKGYDLVNDYMLLVLQQTLTEKLVDLLQTKIKYNSLGLTKINGVMIRELNRYVNNGFLMPNKVYDKSEDIMDATGSVVLLTKGAKLVSGYKYYIAPFSSLSEQDKEDHLLPAITLVLSDSYSIRKITVDGYLY